MSVKLQPVLHESVEEIGSLRVAGLSGRFDPSSYVRIADLWKSVVGVLRSLGWPAATETCGVFRDRNFTTQSFEHLAGVRLADDAPVPRGLEIWSLPARTYLVFRQDLSDGELHPQVAAAQVEIWGARLGRSGRVLAKAPDFQIYPANFKVGVGGWLAYYVPVEA